MGHTTDTIVSWSFKIEPRMFCTRIMTIMALTAKCHGVCVLLLFGRALVVVFHTSLQWPLTTTLVKIMVWSWRILNKVLKEAAGFTDIEAQNGVQSSDDSSVIFLMHSFNAYSLFQQCSKLFPGFLSDYNILYIYMCVCVYYIYIGHIFIIYTLESIIKHIYIYYI